MTPEDERLVLPRPGPATQNYASLEKDGLGAERVEDAGRLTVCQPCFLFLRVQGLGFRVWGLGSRVLLHTVFSFVFFC